MNQTEVAKKSFKRIVLDNRTLRNFFPSVVIIIFLIVAGELLSPGFGKVNNLFNILARASILGVACIGQAYVMISGNAGIDMSVGAVMSMACLMGPAISQGTDFGLLLAVLAFVGIGGVVGMVSGICIQFLKIPSLVMTLAMSEIINGLTLGLTRGQPIMTTPPLLLKMGLPFIGQLRLMTIVMVIVIAIMALVLYKTKFGRSLFIVGSNRSAAKLVGIKVNRIVIGAYMVSSVMAGFAGLMLVGYVGSAQLRMADGYTLLSVAAVVIGGTKLSGGLGNLTGGVLGAIVLFLLTSILVTLGLPDGVRELIQGAILLMVIIFNSREAKLRV